MVFRVRATDKYEPSDFTTSGDPTYYGFVALDGSWYIQQLNTSNGRYRYATGSSNYQAAWAGRTKLSYKQFDNIRLGTG